MVQLQFEGQRIPIPDDIAVSDDAIKRALAPLIPEIASATLHRSDTEVDGVTTITLTKQAGTKNGHAYDHILAHLNQAPQHVNPIFTLHGKLCRQTDTTHYAEEFFFLHHSITPVLEQGEQELQDIRNIHARLARTPGAAATRRPLGF